MVPIACILGVVLVLVVVVLVTSHFVRAKMEVEKRDAVVAAHVLISERIRSEEFVSETLAMLKLQPLSPPSRSSSPSNLRVRRRKS